MSNIETWEQPESMRTGREPTWTMVNPGNPKTGSGPYLNYCRDCGWAGAVALWFSDGGPFCHRCRSDQIGRLVPKDESG